MPPISVSPRQRYTAGTHRFTVPMPLGVVGADLIMLRLGWPDDAAVEAHYEFCREQGRRWRSLGGFKTVGGVISKEGVECRRSAISSAPHAFALPRKKAEGVPAEATRDTLLFRSEGTEGGLRMNPRPGELAWGRVTDDKDGVLSFVRFGVEGGNLSTRILRGHFTTNVPLRTEVLVAWRLA